MGINQRSEAESGLKAHALGSLESIAIIIGAGVFSMAYAARKVGYLPRLACLAITSFFCIITLLYMAEASLRTRGNNQLSGLSRRYLGTFGGVPMGIIPILLLNAARRSGDRQPEFTCGWYAHPSIQVAIIAIFAASGVYAVASALGMLPASW
ncbi:aromatic amino acid transport family protein [Metapseudomonas furukawaii]|uniref:Probable amino acid permease n=1 Tax=Metapseudomonas furukawaii TaxID=1149133 RepID=A0AAD1FDA7_METFU|nr:aromatic amino acid transport family protein [Pseudomonas furukawaii]ELS27620.1 putative amino acid permease [Pseudomonas furukawaii]BAU71802.1 probable amino acid permease [Pseudomonas furukawaii]